jgi:hypothetical protein
MGAGPWVNFSIHPQGVFDAYFGWHWNSRVLVLAFARAGGHRLYAFMTSPGDPDPLNALLFACVTLLVPRIACQLVTMLIDF